MLIDYSLKVIAELSDNTVREITTPVLAEIVEYYEADTNGYYEDLKLSPLKDNVYDGKVNNIKIKDIIKIVGIPDWQEYNEKEQL